MLTIKSFRILLLSSLLSVWFFGIGSWSDFFGFTSYGLLPGDRPVVSSNTVSGQGADNPKEQTENQFLQKKTIFNSVDQNGDRSFDRSEDNGSR